MSKIRELIKRLPHLAECTDPDRFSLRNTIVFDKELSDLESAFAFRESDKTGRRLGVLEVHPDFVGDQRLYQHGMNLLEITVLSGDKLKGRITDEGEERRQYLIAVTKAESESVSRMIVVDEVLPMETAVLGVWT